MKNVNADRNEIMKMIGTGEKKMIGQDRIG